MLIATDAAYRLSLFFSFRITLLLIVVTTLMSGVFTRPSSRPPAMPRHASVCR